MLLDVLGLTAEEALAYRELVARPSAAPDELVPEVASGTADAAQLLSALEQKGLAARSGEDPSRFVASPPSVGLSALLAERQSEIRRAEIEIDTLEELYRTAVTERSATDVVDVLHGAPAIRQRFAQLQRAAREEVQAFVKAPVTVVATAENTAEDEAVARGVRYRVVLEREMLTAEPGIFEQLEGAVEAGEELRVTDSLPIKLLIVDRELALVPLGPAEIAATGALLIRRSGLLDALVALFESAWARGTDLVMTGGELGEVAHAPIDDADAQILSLLLAGLNDQAVAFQLRTSLRTVQRRVRHLMDLARADTRMQLGWEAARLGWLRSHTATDGSGGARPPGWLGSQKPSLDTRRESG